VSLTHRTPYYAITYLMQKATYIPHEFREHDLDDLLPLLPLDGETILREFGKAALSDIIALGDKNNQSMVAEVG
jgi:hypothetical protein